MKNLESEPGSVSDQNSELSCTTALGRDMPRPYNRPSPSATDLFELSIHRGAFTPLDTVVPAASFLSIT